MIYDRTLKSLLHAGSALQSGKGRPWSTEPQSGEDRGAHEE